MNTVACADLHVRLVFFNYHSQGSVSKHVFLGAPQRNTLWLYGDGWFLQPAPAPADCCAYILFNLYTYIRKCICKWSLGFLEIVCWFSLHFRLGCLYLGSFNIIFNEWLSLLYFFFIYFFFLLIFWRDKIHIRIVYNIDKTSANGIV